VFPSERCDGFPQVHEKALARAVDAEADWRDSRRQPGNLRERNNRARTERRSPEQPFGEFGHLLTTVAIACRERPKSLKGRRVAGSTLSLDTVAASLVTGRNGRCG